MIKIYQVTKNYNTEIIEVDCIRVTDSSYWNSIGRNALETNYVKSFLDKKEAIEYLKHRLESKINSIAGNLKYYKDKLIEFENLYKNEN